MPDEPQSKGVLYPDEVPSIRRYAPPAEAVDYVRHVWIPEWDLPPGQTAEPLLLGYPASSLVVQPWGVSLSGPRLNAYRQVLTGCGWAVGVQLRPVGLGLLCDDPTPYVDRELPYPAAELHERVVEVMASAAPAQERHPAAVDAVIDWLMARGEPTAEAILANLMAVLIETDTSVLQVSDLATRLHVSSRTVQRLARRYVGFSPGSMIRRRRLQGAAEQLRAHPEVDLAVVAATAGYADHAHFSRDFKAVVGRSPRDYRADHVAPRPSPTQ